MSVNYSMTKESEKTLRKSFFNFYDHVYISWKKLADTYKRHHDISDLDLEQFFKYEDQSNTYEADMLEECIWHISRYSPFASHLRFIISIIYSNSDLERMADYVISIARYLNQNKIKEKSIVNVISSVMAKSVETMDKIVSLLRKRENVDEHWITTYRTTTKYADEFKKYFDDQTRILVKAAFNKNTAEEAKNLITGASMILKNMERNVDHATNLVENFVYIKNADFFKNKRSKQARKINDQMSNVATLIEKGANITPISKKTQKKPKRSKK